MARELVASAKQESERDGTNNAPPDLAERLLNLATADNRATLQRKREDGVRDDDFRWWWNMPDLERRPL